MKHFMVSVALAGLSAISAAAGAMQQPDCIPSSVSGDVLDSLSQPAGNAADLETDDAPWENAQAVAERGREYRVVERRHDDKIYRLAAPLIDAQYDIAEAEIAQVAAGKAGQATRDFDLARGELDDALRVSAGAPERRAPITALWDQLQRVDLGTTLCHCQSRGADRYQDERLKASLRRAIGAL